MCNQTVSGEKMVHAKIFFFLIVYTTYNFTFSFSFNTIFLSLYGREIVMNADEAIVTPAPDSHFM